MGRKSAGRVEDFCSLFASEFATYSNILALSNKYIHLDNKHSRMSTYALKIRLVVSLKETELILYRLKICTRSEKLS